MLLHFRPGARPRSILLPVSGASACSRFTTSVFIAVEPNPTASFLILPGFPSLIKGSSRTSSPNRKWRNCCEPPRGEAVRMALASPRGDSACDRALVHDRNSAWGAAAPDPRRLQLPGLDLADSRVEIPQVTPAPSQR